MPLGTADAMIRGRPPAAVAYQTGYGRMICGKAEQILLGDQVKYLRGKVQLIFTSPPFPLNHKKKYGNFTGDQYIAWLAQFGPLFQDLLKPNGSIVIELGNAWEPGRPVMSARSRLGGQRLLALVCDRSRNRRPLV